MTSRGPSKPPVLEICIDSLDAAMNAAPFMRPGDRFEVCSSLISGGGLTPSFGLIAMLRKMLPQFPLMAMIRPRPGSFNYTRHELVTMLSDIAAFKAAGVAGVVFGCLTAEGEVDIPWTLELVQAADGLEVTFHRAFDLTPDWMKAVEDLESVGGITRILTSGQAKTALEGADVIAEMMKVSSIKVLPGSGVNASTVRQLLESTIGQLLEASPLEEVHLTAGEKIEPESPLLAQGEALGFGRDEWHLSVEKLKAMRQVVDSL